MGNTCPSSTKQNIDSSQTNSSVTKNNDCIDFVVEFLADTVGDIPAVDLFERIESLIASLTGFKRPRAFLVSKRHGKLFRCVHSIGSTDGHKGSAHEIGNIKFSLSNLTTNPIKAL